MTTFEPGASEVFTHGLLRSPRSTAFLASSPAPIITDGFDVFVQDVIAAMTTDPSETLARIPPKSTSALFAAKTLGAASGAEPSAATRRCGKAERKLCETWERLTRSCGR